MMDLSKMTLDQLAALRTEIAGEFARRSGERYLLRYGRERVRDAPRGGAILHDSPAAGEASEEWFPSLEAANAALLGAAKGRPVERLANGGLRLDYTAAGSSISAEMESAPNY